MLTNLRQLYLQYLADQKASDDPISEVSNIVPVSARADWEHAIPPGFPAHADPQLVRVQSAYLPGYNTALASSIRDGPLRSLAPQFAALGRHSRKNGGKVLIIWVSPSHCLILMLPESIRGCGADTRTCSQGTDDKVVPYRYASRIQTLIPHAELVTIEGGPHDITLTHGDEVSRALLEFLGR